MVKPNLKYISNNFSDLLPTIVKFYDLQDLTLKYQKKLEISRVDKKSTVISISINTLNERKGVVFLNKLIENLNISENMHAYYKYNSLFLHFAILHILTKSLKINWCL